MLEQYKKTFAGVQLVIGLVTLWAFYTCGKNATAAAAFFVVMQVGAVLGAAWASRLRKKLQRVF